VQEYADRAVEELLIDPLATPFIPEVDDWIPPGEMDARPNIQFCSALGTLVFNAASVTPPVAWLTVSKSPNPSIPIGEREGIQRQHSAREVHCW
jgi:hypothetical protein